MITILKIIKDVNPSVNSLMLFGHNPTVSDIANKFLNKSIEQLPTTGVIGFKLELDSWQEIEKSKVLESFYHYPVK